MHICVCVCVQVRHTSQHMSNSIISLRAEIKKISTHLMWNVISATEWESGWSLILNKVHNTEIRQTVVSNQAENCALHT